MSMRDKEPHSRSAPLVIPPHFSVDVAIAEQTGLPVLLSGRSESALRMALEIAAGSRGRDAGGVMIVDAATAEDLGSLMNNAAGSGRPLNAVVLREIQSFTAPQQAAIAGLLTDRSRPNLSSTWRVIATTSVPLFDRVVDGSFNARLFYILNSIHIVMGLSDNALSVCPGN